MTDMKGSSILFTVWFWVFVAVVIAAVTLAVVLEGPTGVLGIAKGISSTFFGIFA